MNEAEITHTYLTNAQRVVACASDNIVLTACPGSGKTRTAGARFATRSDAGLRLAVTSYTNVGVTQIRNAITNELRRAVGPMHFIGTLHKYLLQFAFYPFGHLAMNSAVAPHLVEGSRSDEDVLLNNDPKLRAPLSKFRFRPDGSLVYHGDPPRPWTKAQVTTGGQQRALSLKVRAARAGRASADDAMYWSLQVLRTRPDIAAAVAGRFDELLVDEAQDTSELQLACLHALSATGRLRSLALIGDVDQSIYSFQGASPDGIATLSTTRELQVLTLDENHRSSQTLCNMTARLRPRPQPDRAVGPYATCDWAPELTTYDTAQPHGAVARYRQRMHSLGVESADAVVLARRVAVVDLVNGEASKTICDDRSHALGHAVAAHRTATLGRAHLDRVDKIVSYAAWDAPLSTLDQEQRRVVRNASMKLLTASPALDLDLRSWIRNAAATLKTILADVVDTPHQQVDNIFRSAAGQEALTAETVFATTPTAAYTARTIHNLKGETCDAVLLIADPQRPRHRPSEPALWASRLAGNPIGDTDAEELRILYVALTRARRYCAIALPDHTTTDVRQTFYNAGFVTMPDNSAAN